MEPVARSLAGFQSHQVTVGELESLPAARICGNVGTQVTHWIIFNRGSLACACSLFQLDLLFQAFRLSQQGWWMLGKQPQSMAGSPSLRYRSLGQVASPLGNG